MQKKANILDWPKSTLDPLVWTQGQNLKPEVKEFILGFISSFAQANNFKDTNAWITDVKIVGSLTTNCYNSNSDMDIHIAVDLPKFVEVEHPEMSEKEASEYLDGIRKQVDQVKAKVLGTEHPTEIYFENAFTNKASQEFSGTYSVLNDEWLKYPHIVDQNFDIEKLHPELLSLAKETASELDAAFGEIKRDVQDIKELQETINDWPSEQRESFEKKLQKRLDILENEIKELVDIREDVAEKRKHYKTMSEQEVRFKYLQKYFYMHVLTDLKTLLKQSPELSEKDIPVVENIMNRANLKEAQATPEEQTQLSQTLMIDFDATIAHENKDCTIGEPMKGVKETLTELKNQGYTVVIYSHRGNTEEGTDEIKEFMDKYEIPYDEIYQGEKPLAFRYIDDRAIQFTNWASVLKQVGKAEKKANLNIEATDTYYHGGSGASIRQMAKDGYVAAPLETGNRYQSPLAGRSYLTKDLGYALIYALGGDMVGYQGNDPHYLDGPEGGIVLVSPNEETLIPDEDWLGEKFTSGFQGASNSIYETLKNQQALSQVFQNMQKQNKNKLWEMSYQSMIGKMAIRILMKYNPSYLKELAKESHSLSHEGNLKVLKAWVFDKAKDNPKFKKDGSNFFDIAQEIPVTSGNLVHAAQDLPVINHKTLNRTEPYALFIGTQMFSKTEGLDLFDVFGNHPMITKSNAVPTVTLETLIKENIPVIGKEPKAGDKQPFQDISGVVKTAARMESTWITPNGEIIPVDMGNHASWVADNLDWLSSDYGSDFVREYYEEAEIEDGDTERALYDIVLNLVAKNWTRVFKSNDAISYQIRDLTHPPTNIENFFTQHSEGINDVNAGDLSGNSVNIQEPELGFVKGIQKGLQRKRIVTAQSSDVVYGYSSTQFYLPKETAQQILDWGLKSISDEELFDDETKKYGRQLEPHISIHYHIADKDAKKIEDIVKDQSPVKIKFGNISIFKPEGKNYEVVVLEAESKEAEEMHKKICDQITCEEDHKEEYHPHVTIATVKEGFGKKYEGQDILDNTEITVDNFVLSVNDEQRQVIELKASFMPSNTDLAPSNDWISETGYPGNSEMDAPQNVSDEQTYYSPENDRPRSKNFLKRMLSLFQKPLSKKEPTKEAVPVKEAAKDTSGTGWWIDNSGNVIKLNEGQSHREWAQENSPNADYYSLIDNGWVRVRDQDGMVLISLADINKIPESLNNLLTSFKHGPVTIEDNAGNVKTATINQMAKQWTTPTEHVNQPGMDWGWADYIYNYVDETWQDLLHDWLNLDPKNYVKPVVLIEKIYEDEGVVSAWVHIEFVNTSGNTDAYMKLKIDANIQGEESIEPEGREYYEHLTDWETEVLDYGKNDELEKTSGYGPTNYKGPSTPDELYQDSPYRMNVTYSPEEDEKFLDQNGDGGYPNRWMGRHRGPYYTNEGKVIKMLEETSALETLPPQQPITENTNASTAIMMDDGSIYFSDEPHMVHVKLIKLLGLPAEHIQSGGRIVDGIYIDAGSMSDTMRYVEREMARQRVEQRMKERKAVGKKDIKAAISGEIVNNILNLIHQNGGATWNMSKGNLIGQPYFAVAIYPQKEQIVDEADFENLEGYLVENEGLLSNPSNSFGAWVSGNKVYYDVVATISDKNEAMKLGQQHHQLAIFDLKELKEIPLQRTANLKMAYDDKLQQKDYDKIYSERWGESSDKINGGNEYYDYSELNGNDYPNPRDLDKERALLDQLEKPIDRLDPVGLGEYSITYYDAFPAEGDNAGF